jgi:DNA topoisomerase-2
MAIGPLTLERVQQLCADRDKLNGEVDSLRKTTPKVLWVKDLEALEMQLDVCAANQHSIFAFL